MRNEKVNIIVGFSATQESITEIEVMGSNSLNRPKNGVLQQSYYAT
jgi:hypothetical protein